MKDNKNQTDARFLRRLDPLDPKCSLLGLGRGSILVKEECDNLLKKWGGVLTNNSVDSSRDTVGQIDLFSMAFFYRVLLGLVETFERRIDYGLVWWQYQSFEYCLWICTYKYRFFLQRFKKSSTFILIKYPRFCNWVFYDTSTGCNSQQ